MQNQATPPGIDPKLVMAMQALRANRPDDAIGQLERFTKKNKRDVQAWLMLGSAHGMKGAMEEVMRCSRQVLKLAPDHPGALTYLGNAHAAMGQHEDAAKNYQRALRQAPNDAALLFNTGMSLNFAGKYKEAVEYFKKALNANPRHPHAHAGLGEALLAGGQVDEAIKHFTLALQSAPNLFLAHRGIANAYRFANKQDKAMEHFEQAMRLNPNDADSIASKASMVAKIGQSKEGIQLLDEALARMPDHPLLLASKAEMLERNGQAEEAFKLATALEARGKISPCAAAALLNVSRRFNYNEQALDIANRMLAQDNLFGSDIQLICFAVGKLLDKIGRYDEAFSYFEKANKAVTVHYDHEGTSGYFHNLISTFPRDTLTALPRATNQNQRPVFIVGMPRSGTTLTEQILASHPSVHGAGELFDVCRLSDGDGTTADPGYLEMVQRLTPKYLDNLAQLYLHKIDTLAPPNALRVTDKMPHNFVQLALIYLLFPKATIIHCRRNPIDNCLSIYFNHFNWRHSYASDLESLGRYYLEYERLMEHWEQALDKPILTVQYEETVADQEGMTRRLLAHCGLEWDDTCLEFYKLKREVKTLSYDQVTQKMYSTSVERWRRYEKHIEPLTRILAESRQFRK